MKQKMDRSEEDLSWTKKKSNNGHVPVAGSDCKVMLHATRVSKTQKPIKRLIDMSYEI